MKRRGFFGAIASLFGIAAVGKSKPLVEVREVRPSLTRKQRRTLLEEIKRFYRGPGLGPVTVEPLEMQMVERVPVSPDLVASGDWMLLDGKIETFSGKPRDIN